MIGDSITDAERARPVGEGPFGALGKGYVAQVDALLNAAHPEHAIRVVNMGITRNTAADLAARWTSDVLELKPDWVSVMIGINDVWIRHMRPREPELHVELEDYEQTLDALVARTQPGVQGMVLMTPFYIEPNRQDRVRAHMDRFGGAVKRVATRHGTRFVDVQAAFDRVLEHLYPAAMAWDRVHPDHVGHMVIARAFLNEIGFEWPRGA
ncbi:SGNH/GDSL hydrolase family protein [Stigmatella aurantiaca]|nr:SGNH/GDSL hydrolase family protein [Stigmatella aurantiaca]